EGEPAHLLGAHVAELALEDALLRLTGLAGGLGDAEVDELDLALVADEHVLRRDVAMNEVQLLAVDVALVVRVVEALARLHDDDARLRDGHRLRAVARGGRLLLAAVEDAAQIFTVNELEGDEVGVLDFAEIEDLADVGVVELDGDLGFVDE